MNKPESDIQAQVQNKKHMEVEHIITKEVILNDDNMRSLITIRV